MPVKRKRSFGSRVSRKRGRYAPVAAYGPMTRSRTARLRVGLSRMYPSLNTHHFRRWAGGFNYQPGTGLTEYGLGQQYTFNQLINYAEFTNLYDQYRIDRIKVTFQLINVPDADSTVPNSVGNGNNMYPKIWLARDPDDANIPTLDEMRQRSKTVCRVLQPNKTISIWVKPAVNLAAFGGTTGYNIKYSPWMDLSVVNTPHFGLKGVIDFNSIACATGWQIRTETLFYFTCKNVRQYISESGAKRSV